MKKRLGFFLSPAKTAWRAISTGPVIDNHPAVPRAEQAEAVIRDSAFQFFQTLKRCPPRNVRQIDHNPGKVCEQEHTVGKDSIGFQDEAGLFGMYADANIRNFRRLGLYARDP